MKKLSSIIFVALGAIVLSWFLPWLYSLLFPVGQSDPFVAYSPIGQKFIVSKVVDGRDSILAVGGSADPTAVMLTREDRDSLLPHVYFNQLVGRDRLPDTVAGHAVSVPVFKHSQWVFSSLPRDINKADPRVYLMMESMPERFDLEDPELYFTVDGDKINVASIATNITDASMSRRFTEVFANRGFAFPLVSATANITARKPYDNGYLLIDSQGALHHLKMQVKQPYLVKIKTPGIVAEHTFVLENPDQELIGLFTDTDHQLYAIAADGYQISRLPIDNVDVERQRVTIAKNLFNWVVKISDAESVRWVAIDSETFAPLGEYDLVRAEPSSAKIGRFVFPFTLTFTSIDDCFAYPRLSSYSFSSLSLNLLLAITIVVGRRRRASRRELAAQAVATAALGLFVFIPLIIEN